MASLVFFGRLQDVAGGASRQMDLTPYTTVDDLIASLAQEDARLGEALRAPTTRCIVNNEIVPRDTRITGVSEVAFIPPVGGG